MLAISPSAPDLREEGNELIVVCSSSSVWKQDGGKRIQGNEAFPMVNSHRFRD